jgi:hypothetical protein
MNARTVIIREWSYDEIPRRNVINICPDLLHHADELVTDWAKRVGGLPAVVPEVRATDTPEYYADDGICRRGHHRVGSIDDLNRAGSCKDGSTHDYASSFN